MKQLAIVAALVLATAACFDEQPTGVMADDLALGEYDVGRPAPRLELRASRSAFALLACCGCGCPLDVYGKLPYAGSLSGGRDLFVVGTGFFPEPSAFIGYEDLTLHQFLFDGYASDYNGAVVTGAEVTVFNTPPGGFPAGQGMPVLHDLIIGRMVDLPLPSNGISGIPTGMGGGRRPRVVGTVTLSGGQSVAVLWTWNDGDREYDVAILPTTNPAANSAVTAMNASAGLIVGSMDGHPAMWSIADPAIHTEINSIDGEFRGISRNGLLVGSETGVGGFRMMATDLPANRVSLGVEPFAVNADGLVVGTAPDGSGAIILENGVAKPLPFPIPSGDQAGPRFITRSGLVGGSGGALGSLKPVTWVYAPWDTDGDAAPDGLDNCPLDANPLQQDADADGTGDMCDTGNPPSLALTVSSFTLDEGSSAKFRAAATDPFGRALTYAWDFGDGGTASARIANHVFTDDGVFDVTATVSNGFDTVTDTITITVLNARPRRTVTADATATVGVPFAVQIDATDRGVADILRYKIFWGDTEITNGLCGTSPCTVNVQHTYSTSGSLTMRVRVYDPDGGVASFDKNVVVN